MTKRDFRQSFDPAIAESFVARSMNSAGPPFLLSRPVFSVQSWKVSSRARSSFWDIESLAPMQAGRALMAQSGLVLHSGGMSTVWKKNDPSQRLDRSVVVGNMLRTVADAKEFQ